MSDAPRIASIGQLVAGFAGVDDGVSDVGCVIRKWGAATQAMRYSVPCQTALGIERASRSTARIRQDSNPITADRSAPAVMPETQLPQFHLEHRSTLMDFTELETVDVI